MKVVEQLLRSKSGADVTKCEDAFVVTDRYACVADGATGQVDRSWPASAVGEGVRWGGESIQSTSSSSSPESSLLTGGQLASRIVCKALADYDSESSSNPIPEHPAAHIVDRLTGTLSSLYRSLNVHKELRSRPAHRPAASMALYSSERREVILVGDCQAAAVSEDGCILETYANTKLIDEVTSRAHCAFLEAEMLTGNKTTEELLRRDTGREFIKELLVRQRTFQNRELSLEADVEESSSLQVRSKYDYWVIDGFRIPLAGIVTYTIPSEAAEVILASDGYLKLFPTLEKTEAHLLGVIERDPLMVSEYPGTKGVVSGAESFDDRTYLRIRL